MSASHGDGSYDGAPSSPSSVAQNGTSGRTIPENGRLPQNGLLRNAAALLVSQVITWSLALALTVFLPRYLGAANVGRLILASSIWAVATVLITFGMDVHLTKEVARYPGRLRKLLGTSLALRGALFVLGLAGVLVYAKIARYPAETVLMLWIIAAASLFSVFSNACQAVLQGVERMEYMAYGGVAGKAVYSLGAIVMMAAGLNVYAVAAMAVGGALVTLLVQLVFVARLPAGPATSPGSGGRLLGRDNLRPTWSQARQMLRASIPYLLSDAFVVIYMQVDVVVLSLMLDERAVGWYGSARQLFGTLLFVPTIVVTAIFPTLSRLYASESGGEAATGGEATRTLRQYMRRSFDLLMLLSVPIGLGIAVIANPLVVTLFGPGFANSGPVLAVLGVVMILTSQNMLVGRFLVATDRQRQWIAAQAVMGLATIALDLVLVPWCQTAFANGALGGALSYVVTELALLAVGIVLLPKGSLTMRNASVAARSLAAGLVMVAATWWLRDRFLLIPIAVGAVVYVLALWALRAVPAEELRYIRDVVASTVRRWRGREPEPAASTAVGTTAVGPTGVGSREF
jgi:O-antigen/teichoic acid export membrane protein